MLTLAADCNVKLQIENTSQQLSIHWQMEHAKGHQSGNNLSWEAVFNNSANVLATKKNTEIMMAKADKVWFFYPIAKAHLTINNKLVT
eukprot:5187391-Ditylum_brightwellii.AAC.2